MNRRSESVCHERNLGVLLSHNRYPPLTEFEHYDHGKDADRSYKNLLPEGATATDLTASIGAEVRGVQISKLSNAGKDELARFVAEKKVVGMTRPQLPKSD